MTSRIDVRGLEPIFNSLSFVSNDEPYSVFCFKVSFINFCSLQGVLNQRERLIEIESALLQHPGIAEVAVIGKPDEFRGEVACAFITLKGEQEPSDSLKRTLKELVRENLGPIVVFDGFYFVNKLPKTRSGKIMRRLIKAILSNKPLGDYSTIEDETALEELRKALKERL